MPTRKVGRDAVKFANLGMREKAFVLEALAALCGFRVAMHLLPLKRLLLIASRVRPERNYTVDEVRRRAFLLLRAAGAVPGALCLNQALALQWMLGRRGCATSLEIGVAPDLNRFRAHAWLRYQGITILGGHDAEDKYVRLAAGARADRLP